MRQASGILSTMLEDFVLVADAAQELGMTRWALWKAIERGTLPATKHGVQYLIHRADLDAFRTARPKRGRPRKPAPDG